ncbi:unnamed protein product [Phytophthora lilii]|uniref:Unnamed protein product n=1 Tax=Phytophthora lilii TaxID=2077276 RepID=A0A9W6TI46_9STRA|nr:unnamed protein product [Phytophthora lilii]
MSNPNHLRLAPLTEEVDICRVAAMEAASYPADEAASESGIRFRQKNAGAFFWAAYLPNIDSESETLVGFVNGTLTARDELGDESMSQHDPHGTLLCIHSVVVDSAFRRRGLAAQMLKRYVRVICDSQPQVKRIMLVTKAYLVKFYVDCGFSVTRLSPLTKYLVGLKVDAFTSEAFQGNPAAVVLLSAAAFHDPKATAWMQRVAMENNLSETAYAAPRERSAKSPADILEYDLRWFTPGTEVKLCGHATLSTAFALHDAKLVTADQALHFHTLSGVLVCRFELDPNTQKYVVLMDFPEQPAEPVNPNVVADEIAAALGITNDDIVDLKQTTDLLVRVTPEAFPILKPNFVELGKPDFRGIVVTAEMPKDNKSSVDIQSRFFGPRIGVNEDPVTGSTHCALGPYWAPLLKKTTIKAQQFTPVRGGYITLDLVAAGPGRVLLKGEGSIVLRGKLSSSPKELTQTTCKPLPLTRMTPLSRDHLLTCARHQSRRTVACLMYNNRFTINPFGEIPITAEDRAKLVKIADDLVLAKFEEYEEHLNNQKRVDLTRWKKLTNSGTTTSYLERKNSNPGSKLPALLMVGPLPGTLDENMFGLVSPTLEAMRIKSSYLNDFSAAAVLATIVEPTKEDPFRSVIVKWMEIDIPGASIGLVRNRDYVYVESTGILHLHNGERVGYHLFHSVNFPQAHDLPNRVRGNMSFCGIFHQEGPDRTDCRGTGIMDPGGDMIRVMAVMGMVQATMAGLKYSYCGQMKKLAWLLEQKHDQAKERGAPVAERTCVTCSKQIKSSMLSGFGKSNITCKLCFGALCGTCKIPKKLSFITPDLELAQRKVNFCVKCLVEATCMDTIEAARQQFVYKKPVQPSVYGSSVASDASSASESTMSSSRSHDSLV